ncbi:MAG: glycosyltransferase family 4 protein [Chitinophagales bacterium]
MSERRKKIIFSFPVHISFVKKDESLLREHFETESFLFNQQPSAIIFSFIRQFFFLLRHLFSASAYVSFFAGYSSFLPALFARISGKPNLIILGGTDCCAYPSFHYGNFQKRVLGWFTCKSLRWSNHLLPVDESLVHYVHSYTDNDPREQGYKVFCPEAKAPHTTIPIGYDAEMFFRSENKIPKSFLTVAQMNKSAFIRKGIDLIFKMAQGFPDCTFTLVGHNPNVKLPPVPKNISLVERVTYEELQQYYARHQFYFQLSIMEGFPSAPCEAMLCECVPITSNVAALPHIVGDTGFILAKKNADQLEMLIRAALKSDVADLGRRARQRITDLFPKSVRMKLIDVINAKINKLL